MPQQIQLRRGTASQWSLANPILASGEKGIETDTGQEKTGDGVTAWSALPYFGGSGGGGGGGDVSSVNGQTGVVVLNADHLSDATTTKKFVTAAQRTKIDSVESGATADQTGAEIKALYEAQPNTNVFTDTNQSKLSSLLLTQEISQANYDALTTPNSSTIYLVTS